MGKAAIQAGADAVYIGAPEFGARQAAGNTLEDIATLVKYAHRFGVQVLVTLNTLLHDDEYPRACALAHELYKVGVDALIIQDLNLLNYDLPPIRLHASTQCDNRTPEQVLHLQQLGFRRVVLARELSLQEIKDINKKQCEQIELLKDVEKQILDLGGSESEKQNLIDLYSFQINEIEQAKIEDNELENLQAEKKEMQQFEKNK